MKPKLTTTPHEGSAVGKRGRRLFLEICVVRMPISYLDAMYLYVSYTNILNCRSVFAWYSPEVAHVAVNAQKTADNHMSIPVEHQSHYGTDARRSETLTETPGRMLRLKFVIRSSLLMNPSLLLSSFLNKAITSSISSFSTF